MSFEFVGIIAAIGIWLVVWAFGEPWSRFMVAGQDARCYWVPGYDAPYALSEWTAPIAYVYSPAFLQLLAPLRALAWEPFLGLWTVLLVLAVRFLSGPRLFALALLIAAPELIGGNIHLLIAVAIVIGFRYPAAWSLVLLTKITPGVGLLWFAVRREWRALGIAFGATPAIVAVSLAIDPRAWLEWIGVIGASAGKTSGTWAALPIPLWIRLPIAIMRRGLGRPDGSLLGRPGGCDARPAGTLVWRPGHAPGRDPAARPAPPGLLVGPAAPAAGPLGPGPAPAQLATSGTTQGSRPGRLSPDGVSPACCPGVSAPQAPVGP